MQRYISKLKRKHKYFKSHATLETYTMPESHLYQRDKNGHKFRFEYLLLLCIEVAMSLSQRCKHHQERVTVNLIPNNTVRLRCGTHVYDQQRAQLGPQSPCEKPCCCCCCCCCVWCWFCDWLAVLVLVEVMVGLFWLLKCTFLRNLRHNNVGM